MVHKFLFDVPDMNGTKCLYMPLTFIPEVKVKNMQAQCLNDIIKEHCDYSLKSEAEYGLLERTIRQLLLVSFNHKDMDEFPNGTIHKLTISMHVFACVRCHIFGTELWLTDGNQLAYFSFGDTDANPLIFHNLKISYKDVWGYEVTEDSN